MVALLLMGLAVVEPEAASPLADRQPETITSGKVAETPADASSPALSEDERLFQLAVGTWQDEYKGKRTMTLLADGTATMKVELRGLEARFFAKELNFDMVWSVKDGRFQEQMIGGRPKTKVKLILKMMGDRVDQPILELSESRLLMLDADGETQYDWRRVTP